MGGWGKGCRTGATGVSFGAHIIAHTNRFDAHTNPQDCRVWMCRRTLAQINEQFRRRRRYRVAVGENRGIITSTMKNLREQKPTVVYSHERLLRWTGIGKTYRYNDGVVKRFCSLSLVRKARFGGPSRLFGHLFARIPKQIGQCASSGPVAGRCVCLLQSFSQTGYAEAVVSVTSLGGWPAPVCATVGLVVSVCRRPFYKLFTLGWSLA